MNKIFESIDQWANRKEKKSRKQKQLGVFIFLILAVFITTLVLLVYSLEYNILWLSITSGTLFAASLIPFSICAHLEEKEFQRITNKSVDYYKRRFPFFAQELIAIVLSMVFATAFISLNELGVDVSILYSICIGTFSLPPIIYVFILPQVKETINSTRKELSDLLVKISISKKGPNIKYLKNKQGKIYKLINSSNHTNTQLINSIILFIAAIIMFFNPADSIINQIFPATSIVYSLYELVMLIKLSHDFHSYDTKEYETKMKNQILDIENKEKSKQKKEMLKVYTSNGKFCREESRENCLKPRFNDYYKTAHVIVRNKQNKYFVYQQILDYENALYRWQTTYHSDELAKQNIKDSIINKIKDDFNISINKSNFKLINKNINSDKHQLIEIYLVDENLNNKNIDYNIDLYTTAKLVSFDRFAKILNSNNELPENVKKEILLKLTQQDKGVNKSQK